MNLISVNTVLKTKHTLNPLLNSEILKSAKMCIMVFCVLTTYGLAGRTNVILP
jgi:hypothetical protein